MSTSLALASLVTSYIAAETLSLGLDRIIIKDDQLPSSFHNLRVIFISDIHHGAFSNVARLRGLVTRINKLQPDLILLGGDYLQTRRRPRQKLIGDYIELISILQDLDMPEGGIYAVLGNHDYDFDVDFNRTMLAKAHIQLLHNEGVFLTRGQDKIRLDGVGDLWYGHPNFERAHAHTERDVFTLLLSHQPNFIDKLQPTDGVNFVLAGHTHGSQIKLLGYQPIYPHRISKWEYQVGLIETPQSRMLVSPGIGNEIPYFRFFSPPKFHLITFKSNANL